MTRRSGISFSKLLGGLFKAMAKGGKKPARPRAESASAASTRSVETGPGYPVALVGEQHYQPAVLAARRGDVVEIFAEQGNPYDADALVVVDSEGRTLGYIPRDSWLRPALLYEKKGCRAVISSLRKMRDFRNVQVQVELNGEGPVGERRYVRAR